MNSWIQTLFWINTTLKIKIFAPHTGLCSLPRFFFKNSIHILVTLTTEEQNKWMMKRINVIRINNLSSFLEIKHVGMLKKKLQVPRSQNKHRCSHTHIRFTALLEFVRQGSPSFVCYQFKDFLSTFSRQIFTVSETGPYTLSIRLKIHKCE